LTAQGITCKFWLTDERHGQVRRRGGPTLTNQAGLLTVLTAIANPQRMRVVAELRGGRVHVSELARRLGMSRPLLYMHLDRLEKAGLVVGQLELSEDGKAMKYFALAPFEIRVTADTVAEAVRQQAVEADAAEPE
jgi:DNA-binding transcriptional ArsR family regulator